MIIFQWSRIIFDDSSMKSDDFWWFFDKFDDFWWFFDITAEPACNELSHHPRNQQASQTVNHSQPARLAYTYRTTVAHQQPSYHISAAYDLWWVFDEISWFLTIFRWNLMISNDFSMKSDYIWHFLTIFYDFSMKSDDFWWFSIKFDDFWWFCNGIWWFLLIFWWNLMIYMTCR